MSALTHATINGVTFSRYELQLVCAIKLWIRNANNVVLSDEILGDVVNFLRGKVNRTGLPCLNIVPQIQRDAREEVRAIYMSAYVNKSYWDREANRVYSAWLKQHDTLVNKFVPEFSS